MKTPDYMSYNKYKKTKKEGNGQKIFVIFVTSFFSMLLIFFAIVSRFSPDINLELDNENTLEAKDTGLGVKHFIDERLKSIQMEDNMAGVSKPIETVQKTKDFMANTVDSFSKELDEKVMLPPSARKEEDTADEAKSVLSSQNKSQAVKTQTQTQQKSDVSRPAKVVVGYYNTRDQAKVAQGILIDSGLNVVPFIKDLGGAYTLQIGSYASKAKA